MNKQFMPVGKLVTMNGSYWLLSIPATKSRVMGGTDFMVCPDKPMPGQNDVYPHLRKVTTSNFTIEWGSPDQPIQVKISDEDAKLEEIDEEANQ